MIGRFLGGCVVWAVVLIASSMIFSIAWNGVMPYRFAISPVSPRDSLCVLSCVMIAGRIAGFGSVIRIGSERQQS